MRPLLSVIIAARNEESYLPGTLEALRRQTCRDFETIVVANACVDRTVEIAESYASVIHRDEPGQCPAQNLGGQAARGRLLLFLDADVVMPPLALDSIAEEFGPGDAAGTFKARPSGSHLWYRTLFAVRNLMHRTQLDRSSVGAIICRREHFLEIGGFDEERELRGNSDLIRRLLRYGRYRYLKATVTVSSRRYERWGFWELSRFWVTTYLRSSLSQKYRSVDYEDVR